ncbi:MULTISPECIES: hypothetical protein [Mesorhizobium]|uniref:hypothetical protein n=1 Tax=Mesorhizobium TaxID=68287 RepID=UPI0010A954CB|nr:MULTISPECIES: hypothetical protein [Mesorhizobium]
MADEAAFWLELREPGCVPQGKGPFPAALTTKTLREFMEARPSAFITVVSFDAYGRPMFQDGPETLMQADGRSTQRAMRHIASSKAAFETGEALTKISSAIDRYHAALTAREHGGIAADRLVNAVQEIMGKHWNG